MHLMVGTWPPRLAYPPLPTNPGAGLYLRRMLAIMSRLVVDLLTTGGQGDLHYLTTCKARWPTYHQIWDPDINDLNG